MRILLLSRYGPLGASSRVRFYQYLPYLQEQGFRIDVTPLLPDEYLNARYAGRRLALSFLLKAYARRLVKLATSRKYDVLWVEYELLPWLPAWVESWFAAMGAPYVVDYDDAVFHRYDQHANPWVRRLLSKKIDAVMQGAFLVTVGNEYLAERALQAKAHRIAIVPTCVDLGAYPVKTPLPRKPLTIGWIGSPATSHYLEMIRPALAMTCRDGRARVILIGASDPKWVDVPYELVPWTADTEVSALQKVDIGVMPLPDAPWERGKCGYKLIQYMACCKPVVASPVGINRQIVVDGVNGFLAGSEEQWINALSVLCNDSDLRLRFGIEGRKRVEESYSVQAIAPRLAALLRSAVGGNNTCAV